MTSPLFDEPVPSCGVALPDLKLKPIDSRTATRLVVEHHYLHRRPPISFAFGVFAATDLVGAVTYGVPASRHLQMSACPSDPGKVLELNRVWLHDRLPQNTASWAVSRTLRELPSRIVVSYADPLHGHVGYIYRALNFRYAGWTDMERKTPRYDYLPRNPDAHSRASYRTGGHIGRRQRVAKVKYWTVTGTPAERRAIQELCGWPSYDWRTMPPPVPAGYQVAREPRA